MRWACNWLVQQPLWFFVLVYIVGAGLLVANRAAATGPRLDRSRVARTVEIGA